MCPLMSFAATVIFNFPGWSALITTWLEAVVKNFPMALCFQIFYAGPLVRFIFRHIFKKQLSQN